MNELPPPQRDDENALAPAALIAGYLVWIAATIITAAIGHGDSWGMVARYWVLDFLAGALAAFAVLSMFALRGRLTAPRFLAVFGGCVLPVGLLVAGWEAVSSVYRSPERVQALQATAPIAMLLASGLGLVFGLALLRKRGRDFLAAAVLPPAAMAVATVAYFGFGVLTSDDFRYRDAFSFGLLRASQAGDEIKAECTFTLRKPGDYIYTVSPIMNESGGEDLPGEIVWAGGRSAPAGAGDYPVTLIWRGVKSAGRVEVLQPDTASGLDLSFSPYFGVSRHDGGKARIIRTFPVPVSLKLGGSRISVPPR